jgi:hypothetical protein
MTHYLGNKGVKEKAYNCIFSLTPDLLLGLGH